MQRILLLVCLWLLNWFSVLKTVWEWENHKQRIEGQRIKGWKHEHITCMFTTLFQRDMIWILNVYELLNSALKLCKAFWSKALLAEAFMNESFSDVNVLSYDWLMIQEWTVWHCFHQKNLLQTFTLWKILLVFTFLVAVGIFIVFLSLFFLKDF